MVHNKDLQRLTESETESNKDTILVFFAKHGLEFGSSRLLVRALNGLERIHITTMSELANTAPETIAKIRNIGPKSLELILLLSDLYSKKSS